MPLPIVEYLHVLFGFTYVAALMAAHWNALAARRTTNWNERAALFDLNRRLLARTFREQAWAEHRPRVILTMALWGLTGAALWSISPVALGLFLLAHGLALVGLRLIDGYHHTYPLELVSGYDAKFAPIEPDVVRHYERAVMLQAIDQHWREHLSSLDYLRQGIHLRGYAQKNPKQEYKREAFELFSQLLDTVKLEVTRVLMNVRVQTEAQVAEAAQAIEERVGHVSNVTYTHPNEDGSVSQESDEALAAVAARTGAAAVAPTMAVGSVPKVGRNDPCPCGSGKKYKQCHGRLV